VRVLTSPRRRWWLAAAGLLILLLALAATHNWGPAPEEATASDKADQGSPGLVGSWWNRKPQPAVAEASAQAASTVGEAKPFNPLDTTEMPTFRASPQGRLVVDTQTRHDVERMAALFAQDNGLQRLDLLSADLPVQARHELRDLYQRYLQYDQAMRQAIPPGQGTLEEATRQLQILHELRQQYFGQEGAEAMFGAEEATASQLMALMRTQTDPKASLEERAAQAQDLWKKEHPNGP
jgi:hypothetical protein